MSAAEDQEEFSGGDDGGDYPEGDEPSTPEPKKTTRPPRACDYCRKKKVKCEGSPCTNCRNHNIECTYNTQTRKRPLRKDAKYTQKLEDKLKRLESRFAHDAPEAWEAFRNEADRRSSTEAARHQPPKSRKSEIGSESSPTVPPSAYILVDAMGLPTYLGPTSPWTFLQDTRNYASQVLNMNVAASTTIPDFLDANALRMGLTGNLPQQFSPLSQEHQTQFINAWFAYAGPIQGCLHKPTFESNRVAMHSSNTSAYEFEPLYNAVLGLGACLRGDIQRANLYLQIGWGLIAPRLFGSHSLQTVQAVYLLAFLLFLLEKYGVAYAVLGHAIRLVYANGMHRSPAILSQLGIPMTAIQIEERRRVFWGVYYLDTMLSVILGRPPVMSDADIDADLPEYQDSRLTDQGVLPEEIEEQTETYLYDHLRSLCQQFRKIYDDVYGAKATKQRLQTDLATSIGSVGNDLAGWRTKVPSEYRPFILAENPDNFADTPSEKLHFSLAYYYGHCLVYRPALVEVMQKPVEDFSQEQQPPRQQRSPIGQYINPRTTHLSGPGADEIEDFANRCVIAARNLLSLVQKGSVTASNQLSYSGCSIDLTGSRLLTPCIITASSIIVDNLIRNSSAKAKVEDLKLLQDLKATLGPENPLNRTVLTSLVELEQMALFALPGLAPPPIMPRISEPQPPFYQPQPSTSHEWEHSFISSGGLYIAEPIYGQQTYGISHSLPTPSYQPPQPPYPQISDPYTFTMPSTEGSSTGTSHHQITSTGPILQTHPGILSPPIQGGTSQRRPPGNSSISRTVIQRPAHSQFPYPIPTSQLQNPQAATRPARGGHKKTPSRSRGAHR